ncbi:MAG: hypothetical protein FWE64_03350 [Alphaproteobacteria bacterium]|nr:hypothetical protein [Alphaproteobacteria bacterium]
MERDDNFSPDIKLSGEVPTISFGESDGGPLSAERFNIGGNVFTAYYDIAHRLIFVLDYTRDARTPNVLLVTRRDADNPARKWDDILSNDYGVDLETVRPKKNNKYQKLDIEYDGLSAYNDVINEKAGALDALSEFRDAAARRLANARLAMAMEQMRMANDTISETEISINNAHDNVKALREKLAKIKTKLGKEPTKESAAKILRTQSKIETTKEKQKRAELRLRRARRRLKDAEDDAGAARAQIAALKAAPAPIPIKPKVDIMAEEVKPLFTKDPEIMDERIAFKPVEFAGAPPPEPRRNIGGSGAMPQFVPPTLVAPNIGTNLRPAQDAESFAGQTEYAPAPAESHFADTPPTDRPVAPMPAHNPPPQPPLPPAAEPRQSISEGGPVPMPFTGDGPIKIISANGRSGPSAMYYIMLLLLIALSILTLWLYQNRMTNNVPNILRPLASAQESVAQPVPEMAREQRAARQAGMDRLGEPGPMPSPELADVDPVFLDDDGFMRPVTLPARIPDDMPLDFEMPAPPAEDFYHYEEERDYDVAPFDEVPVPQDDAVPFAHIPSPEFRPVGVAQETAEWVEDSWTDEESEAGWNDPQPLSPWDDEAPAQTLCEDGTAPDGDGCCGIELLTYIPDYGAACCPGGGAADMDACFPPLQ